jgi:hypothetical protein
MDKITADSYRPNANLLELKAKAIEAIGKLERLNALPNTGAAHAREASKAAAYSCAMQAAYAIMLGIGYDMAAEVLREETGDNLLKNCG